MKFKVSLKHIPVGGEVGPIEHTDRIYPCFICRAPTGWRYNTSPDYHGSPCCSDECMDQMDENLKECETEEHKAALRGTAHDLGRSSSEAKGCQTSEGESVHEPQTGATQEGTDRR